MMNTNTNTTTMSIFAEALINNREYKNAKINGEAVGVSNARQWTTAIKAIRLPAYAIRVYRYNNMGNAEVVEDCDQTALYSAIAPVLELIGIVNGAKLNSKNIAESIIASATRVKAIDTSNEMAHARLEKKLAKQALDAEETEETIANYDKWVAEVKRLEELPGNCKKILEIQSESAFVKSVEMLLGDAILKQTMKSAEQVAAEEEAKRKARREKAKAKKQAKKAQASK
jgi:hypothetical protein